MSDRTIAASIGALTDELLSDYQRGRTIDRMEPFSQPDREVIADLIAKLKRLIFPGYFHDPGQRVYDIRHSLAMLMEDVASRLGEQIAIALRLGASADSERARELDAQAQALTVQFLERLPEVRALLQTDLEAFFDGDPAATSLDEIIIAYPGIFAIMVNRVAHVLFELGVPLIPRIMTEHAHSRTGIDIHPGATIGRYFFIDHGTGIVIGETTIIGAHVKVYQGVTLGGLTTRGGQSLRGMKRHPTIEDNVTIYAGASVLGGETVIGRDSVIGSNAFITKSIPPCTTVSMKNVELQYKERKCENCAKAKDHFA